MLRKIRQELLQADLSLDQAVWTRTAGSLTFTSKLTFGRLAVAAIFAGPAAYLFYKGFIDPAGDAQLRVLGVVACPILTLFAAGFAFTRFEKSYRREGRLIESSIRFLGTSARAVERAPDSGTVWLRSEWTLDPPSWEYRVAVDGSALGELTTRDHARCAEAAELVAETLGLELCDGTRTR